MANLDPQAKLDVVQVYTQKHGYRDPNYRLDQCVMHMAQSADGLTKAFVFAQQPLQIGDKIPAADLSMLRLAGPIHPSYFLKDFSQAAAPAAAEIISDPIPGSSKRSYQPDALDPEAYKKFMRNLC